MITIEVNPARVQRVVFSAMSEMEGDFDFAAWVAIRPLVTKIDKRLKALARTVIDAPQDREPDRG